jgi:hypothetical protein
LAIVADRPDRLCPTCTSPCKAAPIGCCSPCGGAGRSGGSSIVAISISGSIVDRPGHQTS